MGLGMPELLVVMGVVLLFGGQKLPQLASGLGRAIREFKTAANGADDAPKQLDR